MSSAAPPLERGTVALPPHKVQNAVLWLWLLSGCVVFIEPSPFEVMFVLATLVFVATGLRLSLAFLPLILTLILYNTGGGLSLMEVADDRDAIQFIVISVYMAVMAIVIACVFSEHPEERLKVLQSASVLGATIACVAGIAGYFDLGGTGALFTRFNRAMGPFKDPNVFSTFIILPLVLLVQGFFVGSLRRPFWGAVALVIIMAGLFLSFSRGAWAVAVGAVVMALALTFLTAQSHVVRARMLLIAALGVALLILALAAALQIDQIRALFETRATLDQPYDQGETGRFGSQRRSLPLLLAAPNGLGPLVFSRIFPEAPHNVYLHAFSAYGWLGGISYLALIASTLWVGWRLVFLRTPWQAQSIAIWSTFFMLILQGLQIDTDHWRHWYVLLGLTWGLTLASLRHVESSGLATLRR